jgi:hypothetical protein
MDMLRELLDVMDEFLGAVRRDVLPRAAAQVLVAKARAQRQLLLERIVQGNQLRVARAPLMLHEAAEIAELLNECAAAIAKAAA